MGVSGGEYAYLGKCGKCDGVLTPMFTGPGFCRTCESGFGAYLDPDLPAIGSMVLRKNVPMGVVAFRYGTQGGVPWVSLRHQFPGEYAVVTRPDGTTFSVQRSNARDCWDSESVCTIVEHIPAARFKGLY